MAHNPKLQVFRIELNPRAKTDTACFRDVLTRKLNLSTADEPTLWDSYWKEFVRVIDLEFFKDDKSKKAFTIYGNGETDVICSNCGKTVLDGIIKGGKYDRERDKAKVDDKGKVVERIEKDDVLLDQFYFLLCTPLNSTKGILILQTYTEDSIYDAFSKFLVSFFRSSEDYFELKIESFVPQKLKDEYKKSARLKGFSFTNKEIIGNIGEDAKEESEEFEITIKIVPKGDTKISRRQELLQKLFRVKFNNKGLDKYSTKVFLADENDNGAHYSLEKDLEHIKPTIYLKDKIKVYEETGLPDFEELKAYSLRLLENIQAEISQSQNETIHEAEVLS